MSLDASLGPLPVLLFLIRLVKAWVTCPPSRAVGGTQPPPGPLPPQREGNFALPSSVEEGVRGWLRTLFGCLQFLFLVLGGLALAAFLALGRRRRPDLFARSPLDFLCGSERLLLSWTHPGSPGCLRRRSAIGLAEVCRNRTDRSTIGRPAGFEVPDGHQPACTSVIIIAYCVRQICSVIRGGTRACPRCSNSQKDEEAISYQPSAFSYSIGMFRLRAKSEGG